MREKVCCTSLLNPPFYESLKNQNYFSDGYFLLFGDHRRFESLEEAELNDGGYAVWHERIICSIVGKGIAPQSVYNGPFSLVDMNSLLHFMINGQPVNDQRILQASLSSQLGIDTPFSISLVDDDHGTYLVRSEKGMPMYISIFGDIPFSKLPGASYRDAVTYLIENNQQMITKISNGNASSKSAF